MAADKEFVQNLQELVANKLAEKEEIIAMKDMEIRTKNEEISHLRQKLHDQKYQMTQEIAVLKAEILRLRPNGKEMA